LDRQFSGADTDQVAGCCQPRRSPAEYALAV